MAIDPTQPSTWINVHDGHAICPDCKGLAGKTAPLGEWLAMGLYPSSGKTICGEYCLCALVPQDWAGGFGQDMTVDLSIGKLKLITGAEKGVVVEQLTANQVLRWEAMTERETGLATAVDEDIRLSAEMYLTDPKRLQEELPRHYRLIKELLD